jgi:hypothetical protein
VVQQLHEAFPEAAPYRHTPNRLLVEPKPAAGATVISLQFETKAHKAYR